MEEKLEESEDVMRNVVITSALRTPVGSFGGVFKDLLPSDLIVPVIQEVVKQSELQENDVDEVILGHCIQRTDMPNTARTAALLAGLDETTIGYTIQRQCASGMQAIISAAMQIQTGLSDIVIAGGVEAMSSSPYLLKQHRYGAKIKHGEITDSVWEVLEDPIHHIMMGETAENLASAFQITREQQDELAYSSHSRACLALQNGYFDTQIVPILLKKRNGEESITTDEHPRKDVSLDKLAKLPPAFRENGTVTVGNSSGINDGAAALVLMSEEEAEKRGLKALAKIVNFSFAGVDPRMMGWGPVPAIRQGLERAGWNLQDVQLFEINEAFAAQYLTVEKELGLDRSIVNVNGSGISLGHPIGCTGAKIVVSLVHELQRRKLNRGLAALCVGGGMGVSVIIEAY